MYKKTQLSLSLFLTISHEGGDDPQLIFSYKDALIGQNAGVVKQLWHM